MFWKIWKEKESRQSFFWKINNILNAEMIWNILYKLVFLLKNFILIKINCLKIKTYKINNHICVILINKIKNLFNKIIIIICQNELIKLIYINKK